MMNHNLLPKAYKQTLHKAYVIRFFFVCLLLADVALMVGVGALLPSYFRVWGELHDTQDMYTTLAQAVQWQENTATTSAGSQILQERAHMLTLLGKHLNEEPISKTMQDALSLAPLGVVISGITYDRSANTLLLEGKAETREDLVAFVHALEESSDFSHIPSPAPNLVKSTAIPFRLAFSVVVH